MSNQPDAICANLPDGVLRAYVEGCLDGAEAAEVEAHLACCAGCCELLTAWPLDSFATRLRQAYDPAAFPTAVGLPALNVTPQPDGATLDLEWGASAALPQLPGYEVLRELGRGGMGVVYEAVHAVMGRRVAVKLVHPDFLRHPAAVQRFQREARAAARLSHPNLVTAFDAGRAGDGLFLAMELVRGESLADVLRRDGPLPVAEACEYVRQAALGLQHAHEHGLVHRDVKPQNLMRAADGAVKVLDFGLATLVGDRPAEGGATAPNAVMGTPDYMAPEQAEDARTADARADVYSLGCTLYHLLTGQAPFPAESVVLKLLAHRGAAPPRARRLRPDVPAGLDTGLRRALAKRPQERFASAAELAEALGPFTDPGYRPETAPRAARGGRARRVVGIAALVLAGLAVTAGVIRLSAGKDREMVIETDHLGAAHDPEKGGTARAVAPPARYAATAFREVHGADEAAFVAWTDALAKDDFRPVSLSARAGSDRPRFNGIAVRDGRDLPTVVRLGMSDEEPHAHFFRMRDLRYRQLVSCLYDDGGRQKQADIWVKDGVRFTGYGNRLDAITDLLRVYGADAKMVPIYLSAELRTKGPEPMRAVFAPDGGIAWWARRALSLDGLRAQVADWEARNWRPTFLNAYSDGGEIRFLAIGADNFERLDWDCRIDLAEAAYENALKENDRLGLRPVAVTSYCRKDEVYYAAVWERYQTVERLGPPRETEF